MKARTSSTNQNEQVWTIKPAELQVGDIILSTTNHSVSKFIRFFTASQISHASIHVGKGYVIEAVGDGVRKVHARCLLFEQPEHISVLRHKSGDAEKLQQTSKVARALLYRPYSMRGAIGTLIPYLRRADDPGRFCSQLVAESFHDAGLPLMGTNTIDEVLPEHFKQSNDLVDVTETAIRSMSRSAYEKAVQGFRPSLAEGPYKELPPGSQVDPSLIERACLLKASELMAKESCFREPYHFFDVLRQLEQSSEQHSRRVRPVDDAVADLIDAAVSNFRIKVRSSISGIIDEPMAFGTMPFPEDDALAKQEHTGLVMDLAAAADWDMDDWFKTIEEMKEAAVRTGLRSLWQTLQWLMRDFFYVRADYEHIWLLSIPPFPSPPKTQP